MDMVLIFIIFVMSIVLHEVSHGFVAYARGDETAKMAGRLTLNPLKHIDPIMTVLLPVGLFFSTGGRFAIGMAKPVPVDFKRLRHPKSDMFWVAFAGPCVNLILMIVFNTLFQKFQWEWLLYPVFFNLALAVFNLCPIPPLDGSRMLASVLPTSLSNFYMKLERYGLIIILILYFTGAFMYWMIPGMDFISRLFGLPQLVPHS